VIIGVPLIAAVTDDEAEYLASSTYQRILGILTGDRRCLPPPVADYMNSLQPHERSAIADFLAAAVIGGPERVREGLIALIEATAADELMFVCDIFDPALRARWILQQRLFQSEITKLTGGLGLLAERLPGRCRRL
jgi:alkanesulfonate monooxygenase SsuD/methylene tetrahydromethanopterin reductase-like flavin-dependent oxidoreductase (luciferase family)